MTEFISRNHGQSCFEVIIKTTDPEHYEASVEFARRLIDLAKPVTDNNVGCKWIPVTERLPEENDRYLCNVKSFAFPGCSYHAILHYDKHDGFREGNIYTDDVTHWMPLPEPPKEVME